MNRISNILQMRTLSLLPLYCVLFLVMTTGAKGQTYPVFDSEIDVTISGMSFDAMEPFLSSDGDYLFFNNLNDGINTKLYYATKVNDSSFIFAGELTGANQTTPPYLDAVADMDSLNNFYWTSTRNYPFQLDNLYYGTFSTGIVTLKGRVHGDFNKGIPGWLVMDHGISSDGQLLYYNNASFDSTLCQGPCETELGIARKVNDSTFNKLPESDSILQNIIDTNTIFYAPCISRNNLELFFTRYPRDTITAGTLFEICVSVRNTPLDTFSSPAVLFSGLIAELIEAPALSADNLILYYHKKTATSHKVVMRYRLSPLSRNDIGDRKSEFKLFPIPARDKIIISCPSQVRNYAYTMIDLQGRKVKSGRDISDVNHKISLQGLSSGAYLIQFYQNENPIGLLKFVKE